MSLPHSNELYGVKREELNGVKSLRASRWEVQLQAAGVIFSLSTTCLLVAAIVDVYLIAQDGADPSDFLRLAGILAYFERCWKYFITFRRIIPNPSGSYANKHGSISVGRAQTQDRRGVLAACANLILNTVGAVLLSGAHRLLWWSFMQPKLVPAVTSMLFESQAPKDRCNKHGRPTRERNGKKKLQNLQRVAYLCATF